MTIKKLLEADELTDVQKNYRKVMAKKEISDSNKRKAEKYKTPENAWKMFKNNEIEYEDMEDALIHFSDIGKITDKQLKDYQDKAEKLLPSTEDLDNMMKDYKKSKSFKNKVMKKIKGRK